MVTGLDDTAVIEENITSAGDVASEEKGSLSEPAVLMTNIFGVPVKKRRAKKTRPKKGQNVDEARDAQPTDRTGPGDGVVMDTVSVGRSASSHSEVVSESLGDVTLKRAASNANFFSHRVVHHWAPHSGRNFLLLAEAGERPPRRVVSTRE